MSGERSSGTNADRQDGLVSPNSWILASQLKSAIWPTLFSKPKFYYVKKKIVYVSAFFGIIKFFYYNYFWRGIILKNIRTFVLMDLYMHKY